MTAEPNKRLGQDNAFRKVALKGGHLTGAELERAQREQGRQGARGTHLAIYQVVLRMRLLTVAQVKEILAQVKTRYFFCGRCYRENVRRKDGSRVCRHCEATVAESKRTPAVAAPPGPEDHWIGRQLGNCEILAKLGEGGSGTVYRARQLSLDRHVALKLLFPWLAVKEDHARRFLREARMMARVEHPNVVPVYDSGREGDTLFLVMSYVEGANLGRYLAERGKLSPPEVVDIASQVLRGLASMHAVGVIHRDLKPENVMITPDRRAMVMDFGLVRAIESADSLTASEQILGTPFYMSPEQCLNRGVDERADLYSLGVTCYQLLTGERPFGGTNAVELIMSHLYEKPTPLRELEPSVSAELAEVVNKMLAKDKRARYESARAALEDLERLASGKTPVALEHRVRARRQVQRRRAMLAAGAATLAVVAALVGYYAGGWGGDGSGPETPVVAAVDEAAVEARGQLKELLAAEERELSDDWLPEPPRLVEMPLDVDRQARVHLEAMKRRLGALHERWKALARSSPEGSEAHKKATARFDLALRVEAVRQRLEAYRLWIDGPGSGSGSGDGSGSGAGSGSGGEAGMAPEIAGAVARIRRLLKDGELLAARKAILAAPVPPVVRPLWRLHWLHALDEAESTAHLDAIASQMRTLLQGDDTQGASAVLAGARAVGPAAQARLAALRQEVTRALRVAADAEARQREKARLKARDDGIIDIGEALLARDPVRARRILRRLEGRGWDAPRVRADARLSGPAKDVERAEGVFAAAREALRAKVGGKMTLERRDGEALSGVVVRRGDGLFALRNGSGLAAVTLSELSDASLRRLAKRESPLAWATVMAYGGEPRAAVACVERLPTSEVRARLLGIADRRMAAVARRDAQAALEKRKVIEAWRDVRWLALRAPGKDVTALMRRLDVLCGKDHVLLADGSLFAAGADQLKLRGKKTADGWRGPFPLIKDHARLRRWRVVATGSGQRRFHLEGPERGFAYPFVVRCQIKLEGKEPRGGVSVGDRGNFAYLEADAKGRWRLRHKPAGAGDSDILPWKAPPETTAGLVRVELVVHPTRIVVRVGEPGGRVVAVGQGVAMSFMPREKARVGLVIREGTTMRIYQLTVQPLKAVEERK